MKITFVLPNAGLSGGIRVIAIYANQLKQRGHEVVIVSNPEIITMRRKVKSLLLGRGLPKPEYSYLDGTDIEHRILERARPVTDADVPDADVVIATYYTTAEGVLRLSRAKGAKAIFIQGYEVEEGRVNSKLDSVWRMPMHKIAVSKWLVELAREKFGDSVVSHVRNSVDLSQFHAVPRAKGVVPTLGLLYSRSWFKGCRTSLDALKHVAARLPSLRLVCFGAEQPSRDLRLPPYAEFHYKPPQDKLRRLYEKCDAWLCGSNREGFGLTVLEAMACRCPAVSTRAGGLMDIIEDGMNGYLVEVGDAKGLADRALHVLSLAQEEWRRMSNAAYHTASRYTWDDATDLFEKSLELALARRERGELQPERQALSLTPNES